MAIEIRKAQKSDMKKIMILLNEVLELHAKIRPDIFISGTTKYTEDELLNIISNENTPVFVACDDNNCVLGYAFCIMKKQPFSTNMRDFKTLFILSKSCCASASPLKALTTLCAEKFSST